MVIDSKMIVITMIMTVRCEIIMTITERVGIAVRQNFL
jgi:hypothetical protein